MSLEAEVQTLADAVRNLNTTLGFIATHLGMPGGVQVPAVERTGRGRPAGSTNKPKVVAPSQSAPTATPAAGFDTEGSSANLFDPFADAAAPARTYNVEEVRSALKTLAATRKPEAVAILSSRSLKGVGEIGDEHIAGIVVEIENYGVKVGQ